jgi:hypothetical protein
MNSPSKRNSRTRPLPLRQASPMSR